MRELKFDLTVNSNALLCPNPSEWYAKSYIDEDTLENYRVVSGIKNATKISTFTFADILKPQNCAWASVTATLDAISVSVTPLDAMVEVCQSQVEDSFYATKLGKGSAADFTPNDLMSHFYDVFSLKINEEIQTLRWQGNTGLTSSSYLKQVDGYEKKFLADASIVDVSATASVTAANVLGEMIKVKQAAPSSIIRKKADLRFYVSTNVAEAFEYAVSAGNTQAYLSLVNGQTFLGIKIVVCPGMTDDKMVLTLKDNLIYVCDGEGDADSINTVDMRATTNEPNIRSKASLKIGFFYTNPSEIIYYS